MHTPSIDDRKHALQTAMQRLGSVDLSLIRMKLADPDEGQGWSEPDLIRIEREYRRFLALTFAYPDRAIVPDRQVDEFWHQHILDTRAYARDSVLVFGAFLHHFPYFGMSGDEDAARLTEGFDDTARLYRFHFGEPRHSCVTDHTSCNVVDSSSKCSTCSSCRSKIAGILDVNV